MTDRINELEGLIKRYSTSYYSGAAEISDEEWDELVEELRELDPNSELLRTTGWGFQPTGKKERHRYGKCYGISSKIKDISDIPERFSPTNSRLSAKLDGLSVVSYYKDGHRYLALTRGNGEEGKVVTDKINLISPTTVDISDNFTGAIRGEVLIDVATWEHIKDEYEDNPSANPRNIASGLLNRDEISEETKRLRYVVYKITADPEGRFDIVGSESYRFKGAEDYLYNNFREDYVPEISYVNSMTFSQSAFNDYYTEFCKTFPCDGIVITKRELNYDYTKDGEIIYDEVAFKFQSEKKIVTVTDVDWNAGRTGRIVPRIWFDPVQLSGAVVRKCTAHNAAFIRDNKINIGTVIEVTRSGEVIPYMTRVVDNPNTKPLLPTTCPNCGALLEWNGDDLVCQYENESQLIYRFISTVAEVDGVGWKLYDLIIEILEMDTYKEFLSFLSKIQDEEGRSEVLSTLLPLVGGSVTKDKCTKVIEKLAEEIDPTVFLVACNIPGLSWNSANNLLKNYPEFLSDVKTLKMATNPTDFMNSVIEPNINYNRVRLISGFGSSFVSTLKNFSSRIYDIATRVKVGSTKSEDPDEEVAHRFSVAITGSLSMKRSEFEEILKSYGVTTSSNFKEIKYLVTNNPESGSSKMKKAKNNNVEIISEEDILKLLRK